MKTIDDTRNYLNEIAEEMNDLKAIDTMEMYRLLTTIGDDMPGLEEGDRVDENFVPGCISNVYVAASLVDGAVQFRGSSESLVVRGYLAILIEALSGLSPADVVDESRDIIDAFGRETDIRASLTRNRANAFGNIYEMMIAKAQILADR